MKTRLERGRVMKRKNGFTLIELLAVIVILAIIALIAVPTVMNIISKANKSAFKDSAYGILKAGENYYMGELLKAEGMTEDKMFDFSKDTSELEINGSKPTDGKMIVNTNGKVAMAIHNGKHCVKKGFEDDDVTITDDVENCEIPIPVLTLSDLATTHSFTSVDGTTTSEVSEVNGCAKSGICEAGTAFAIKVNNTEIYKFYVLSDTGNEVTLIMDRNLGEQVAWLNESDYGSSPHKNDKGPITVLNYLNIQTENWDNIPAINSYEYINTEGTYVYQKLKIENGKSKLTSKDGATVTEITGVSRARLLTYEEATSSTIGCTGSSGSCPSWIYGNLSGSNTKEQPYGYWLLSADPSNWNISFVVFYSGKVTQEISSSASFHGSRPVITLSK